jgi:AcrR family transcriptional regulator
MARNPHKAGAPETESREPQSVREDLLAAARRLFAAKGYDGVSVKDLANETGHNAALINYYFGSKEGLFRECVLPLLGAGMANAECTLRPANSLQDFLTRFELFVETFITTHLKEQDICIILQRDLHTEAVKQLFKDHVVCVDDLLRRFFEGAKRRKFVRPDIDTDLLAKLVVSSLFNLIAIDRFRENFGQTTFLNEKRRSSTISQVTRLLLGGLLLPNGL